MQWLPLFLVVPALCFAGAYGIQKRRPWAWYAGWVVAFLAGASVASYTVAMLSNAETLQQILLGLIFSAGGMALWTFWAVWWATVKDEFIQK
jgi:hypothetical protein